MEKNYHSSSKFSMILLLILLVGLIGIPLQAQDNITKRNFKSELGVEVNTFNGNLYYRYHAIKIAFQDT